VSKGLGTNRVRQVRQNELQPAFQPLSSAAAPRPGHVEGTEPRANPVSGAGVGSKKAGQNVHQPATQPLSSAAAPRPGHAEATEPRANPVSKGLGTNRVRQVRQNELQPATQPLLPHPAAKPRHRNVRQAIRSTTQSPGSAYQRFSEFRSQKSQQQGQGMRHTNPAQAIQEQKEAPLEHVKPTSSPPWSRPVHHAKIVSAPAAPAVPAMPNTNPTEYLDWPLRKEAARKEAAHDSRDANAVSFDQAKHVADQA